ncbi:LuxR C-terminal-related transcriptional regulator [Streptomyces hygroscopicus]|uniref:helix-turn-helix transcriptional regulator n=1 Tax=Streptomyces sp. KHY 26 TaxID=3097359 RepID=UPI002553D064|nr:LuxR C-terminal-related transcriptional regulator [Streptomyces hygroscopicus]
MRTDEAGETGPLRGRPRSHETVDDLGLSAAEQPRPDRPDPAVAGGPERTATSRPVVGVLPTGDAISELALDSFVKQCPYLLWTGDARTAEVAVASLHSPDTGAVTRLRTHAGERSALVLVVGGEWRASLHQAIELGVRAVLPRAGFTWEAFTQTVRQVRAGHADLPPALQGRLMDQMQYTYREVLVPRGLTPGGLTEREAKVLRLVADGHELQDIGNQLGYSERTIKNVLYGVIKRHRLRNRSHAVSFAIRSGLI